MTTETILPSSSPRRHKRQQPKRSGPTFNGTVVAAVVIALLVVTGAYKLFTRDNDAIAPPSANPLSHAQLVVSAEHICKLMNTAQQAVATPPNASPAALAAGLDKTVTISRRAISKLRRLVPPVTERAAYGRVLASADGLTTRLSAASAAVRARKTAPAKKLFSEVEKANTTVNAQFVKLGMPTCGS